jgi:NDP-mannose synthase
MQAVILAGGKGTRLRQYTQGILPKPLVPIGETPILDIVIRQLKQAGFTDIIISTGYLAHLIEAYFGDGSKFGVKIRYVKEDTPLNTAGALKLIDGLDENFLVMNGDLLTNANFSEMFNTHVKSKATATIGVVDREEKIDYGVIHYSEDVFYSYDEKPTTKYSVSMGINILHRKSISYISNGEAVGMPDLMTRLEKNGEKVCVFKANCKWLDIGRPADCDKAQEEDLKGYL